MVYMRLTNKFLNTYSISENNVSNGQQKLGLLEDIEDGLGVELAIREKALQKGAWYRSNSRGVVFCPFVRIVGKGRALELKEGRRTPTLCAKTCDYGKTWALTEGELLCSKV